MPNVTVNLRRDSIVLKIPEVLSQEIILSSLKKKLPELKRLYQEEKIPIFITGKILKNKEIAEIQELIKEKIDVEVEFDSPKELGLHGIKKTYNKEIGQSETKFHRGSLRSGQRIEFEGSLVIIGEVNSGAEVVAGDNVIVLGNLRGLAHAGAKGNKKAIIAAEKIDCTQLRIANIIYEVEKSEEDYNVSKTYAYVEDDKIIVE